MKKRFLIIGSGKMARNIGYYFLRKKNQVYWMTSDIRYLESIKKWYQKIRRRLAHLEPGIEESGINKFYLTDDPDLPDFDIIIESTRENREEKRTILRKIEHLYSDRMIIASNSSSILPRTIHPRCLGLHFFYPVELTGIVELIVPSGHPDLPVSELLNILRFNKLSCVRETEKSAFLINRLLLPLQSECFHSLISGYDPHIIDQSTATDLLPLGQLRLMDSIGLDILYSSIHNFMNRMDQTRKYQYSSLLNGLDKLLSMGKMGKKNGDGLLMGSDLPWKVKNPSPGKIDDISKKALYLFINTCYYAMEQNEISPEDLDAIHKAVFSPDVTLHQVVNKIKPKIICKNLEKWYKRTELEYFSPAGLLKHGDGS